MNVFLRLKHWQLFLITIGIPFVVNLGLTVSLNLSPPTSFTLTIRLLASIISALVLLGWLYTLAINLHQHLPEAVVMNLKTFKVLLPTVALYCIFFFIFLANTRKNLASGQSMNFDLIKYIMPFHLVSIICLLYCVHFIARSLKAVELKRPVSFDDFAGEFFLLLFYPVGIWIIQPRINKLLDKHSR